MALLPEISKAYSSNGYFKDYDLIEFTIDGKVVAAVSTNSGGDRALTIELEPRELILSDIEFIKEGSDMRWVVDMARADVEVQALLSRGSASRRHFGVHSLLDDNRFKEV